MADHLHQLGDDFKALRAQSASLRDQLGLIREQLAELRPKIQAAVIDAARAGRRQADIVSATGYTRENIRQICRDAGIEPRD